MVEPDRSAGEPPSTMPAGAMPPGPGPAAPAVRGAPAPQPPARERLRADAERYFRMANAKTFLEKARLVADTESLWVIASFRFGQWLQEEAPSPVRQLLRIPHGLVHRTLQRTYGVHLFPCTRIGPGLYIGHSGGIWVSPHAELGANCNVNHGVTIGVAGAGRGAPRLGDNVWIGPGAIISGPVRVGSGAVVGANSLVATHVPANALALGVPARVVGQANSSKLVR